MTADLLITLARFTAEREHKGTVWCRKSGVGLTRRVLGAVPPPNVVELTGLPPTPPAHVAAQKEAVAILEAHCRICRGCKLGRA